MKMTGKSHKHLVIRTDASPTIGTGHVMRCLALAQAWQDNGGEVVYASLSLPSAIRERLTVEGIKVLPIETDDLKSDAESTIVIARNLKAEWVVVDGYRFDVEYFQRLKDAELRVLCIDGLGRLEHYSADVVLNNNISVIEELYSSRAPNTKLLLGSQYVLLRKEFTHQPNKKRKIPDIANKLLITLGGGDTHGTIFKILKSLNNLRISKLQVSVILGSISPDVEGLRSIISNTGIELIFLENVNEMQKIMLQADLAISAGGSTCWEIAFYGLPNIIIVIAENQKANAKALDSKGVSIYAGKKESIVINQLSTTINHLINSKQQRQDMHKNGRQLIDGLGSSRIVKILENLK